MKRTVLVLALVALSLQTQGQGFQNLNFESAQNLTNDPGTGVFVPATNALPYWTAYSGPNALSDVLYVTNFADTGGFINLVGGSAAIGGNFSIWLGESGLITQTNVVPADALSLQFEAYGPGLAGSLGPNSGLAVTLGGQNLSFSTLSENANYWVYGANIPAGLAGQMEPLDILTQPPGQPAGTGNVLLDNIEFSPVSVPEPSACALLALGVILFGLCRRRKPKHSVGWTFPNQRLR